MAFPRLLLLLLQVLLLSLLPLLEGSAPEHHQHCPTLPQMHWAVLLLLHSLQQRSSALGYQCQADCCHLLPARQCLPLMQLLPVVEQTRAAAQTLETLCYRPLALQLTRRVAVQVLTWPPSRLLHNPPSAAPQLTWWSRLALH